MHISLQDLVWLYARAIYLWFKMRLIRPNLQQQTQQSSQRNAYRFEWGQDGQVEWAVWEWDPVTGQGSGSEYSDSYSIQISTDSNGNTIATLTSQSGAVSVWNFGNNWSWNSYSNASIMMNGTVQQGKSKIFHEQFQIICLRSVGMCFFGSAEYYLSEIYKKVFTFYFEIQVSANFPLSG